MFSQRKLIQTIEFHTRSRVETVANFRFWHGRYLEWAEQRKAQGVAQAEAGQDAALAAAQAHYEETVRTMARPGGTISTCIQPAATTSPRPIPCG